jgi:transposase
VAFRQTCGRQRGHRGETLPRAPRPDRIVEDRLGECRSCHTPLSTVQVVRYHRQHVVKVVSARLRITEQRVAVVRCEACGQRTKAEFSEGVRASVQYGPSVLARALFLHNYQLLNYARTAEAMRELFGCALSTGAPAHAVRQCATGLVETELKLKRQLRRSPVLHADETMLRVAGRLHYVHVAGTARLTHYGADAGDAGVPSTRSASSRSIAAHASTTGGSPTPSTRSVNTPCAGRTC